MKQTAMLKYHHPDPSVGVDVNLKLDRKERMYSVGTYDDDSHNHDNAIEMETTTQ